MSRRQPPPPQPPQPAATTDPPNLATPTQLQCQQCLTTWPYTHTIAGPGGPIGILFQLEFLGCPVCKSPQAYKAV